MVQPEKSGLLSRAVRQKQWATQTSTPVIANAHEGAS
ncbi:hypothetical protein YSA_08681 [Pseudomonas putida ND6]|uniref:Uncharacterized protein n=1 Tax=Pseudomonas putida ND6 TaxID=231023 RepID=I3V145_PSEPU|nr:hypothetical protein YSA_08681 [Pseudomonas putida ND6]